MLCNFHSRLLVDTGDGQQPEYYENLSKALKSAGVEISSVILTHWHHDHVGGILGVVERLGLKVRCLILLFLEYVKYSLHPLKGFTCID